LPSLSASPADVRLPASPTAVARPSSSVSQTPTKSMHALEHARTRTHTHARTHTDTPTHTHTRPPRPSPRQHRDDTSDFFERYLSF
jgi:hypothetical protein